MAVATSAAGAYIAGEWRDAGGKEFATRNPASDETLLVLREGTSHDVADAVAAARDAARGWAATPAAARAELLHAVASRIDESVHSLAADITTEVGKPAGEALEEARRTAAIVRYHAGAALDPSGSVLPHPGNGNRLVFTERRPLGHVGLITPWNLPLAIPVWKLAPALALGNTVVMKPAPHAALLARRIVELFSDLPPGVFNVVQGGAVPAAALAGSDVRAVSVTGSTTTGKQVAALANATGARCQAQLGGKNASVVLADADLDHAASTIARAAMGFAGQKCTATSRAIVERPVAAEFTARLVARVRELVVGAPSEPQTDVGPLIDPDSVERVDGFVARAVDAGCELLAGGEPLRDKGRCFYAPTLLRAPAGEIELKAAEVFGPVLTLEVARDPEDALTAANATNYGLAAAVFTRSLQHGLEFARELAVGLIRINEATPGVLFNAPFAPRGESGIGLPEQGKAAQDFFTEVRTVTFGPPD